MTWYTLQSDSSVDDTEKADYIVSFNLSQVNKSNVSVK